MNTVSQALCVPQTEQTVSGLTAEHVFDLPVKTLLAQTGGQLGTTEINEPGFFGYITVHTPGRFDLYLPSQAGDSLREMGTRYLLTVHLGLSTHLFPEVITHTVFDRGVPAVIPA